MYSECVFVALGIQHANALARCHIFFCGLSGCTIFFHIISSGRRYGQTDVLDEANRRFSQFYEIYTGRTQCGECLPKANLYSQGYFLLCGGLLHIG